MKKTGYLIWGDYSACSCAALSYRRIMSNSDNKSGIFRTIAICSAVVGLVAGVFTCTKNMLEATQTGIGVTKELSGFLIDVDQQDASGLDKVSRQDTSANRPKIITHEDIIPVERPKVLPNETINLTGTWTDNMVDCEINQYEDQLEINLFGNHFTGEIEGKKGTLTGTGLWGQQVDMDFTIKNENKISFQYKDLAGNPATFILRRKNEE